MAANLRVDFLRSTDVVAIAKGRVIKTMLTNHPYAQAPLPAGVFSPDGLGEVLDRLQGACDDALCHDSRKIEARKKVRIEFDNGMRNLARHLEIWANGDVAKLQSTGFDLRRAPKRVATAPGPLPAPLLVMKHGTHPGTMTAHMKAIAGAVLYELYFTSDPTREENWTKFGSSVTPSKIPVAGLNPGQNYWFRSCGVGATGNGAWSVPFPLMSL